MDQKIPRPGDVDRAEGAKSDAANDARRLAVADIWRSVLDLDSLGPDDHFIDLGGDSIAAVQIVAKIQRRFGIRLQTDALLERPTVNEFSVLVGDEVARLAQ